MSGSADDCAASPNRWCHYSAKAARASTWNSGNVISQKPLYNPVGSRTQRACRIRMMETIVPLLSGPPAGGWAAQSRKRIREDRPAPGGLRLHRGNDGPVRDSGIQPGVWAEDLTSTRASEWFEIILNTVCQFQQEVTEEMKRRCLGEFVLIDVPFIFR